jgi:methyltransferase (TIGR00027 family)
MSAELSIKHVSDTALWVAHFRAQETQRPDAVFQDPLASLLAGERGRRIARSFPRSGNIAWGTVVRTSATDRLIGEALELGVDSILNLGAGLDTRPYRMRLPAQLHWIEVDFPSVIEFKRSKLSPYKPACALERVGMDLLDRSLRHAFFSKCGSRFKSTLLISEGLIPFMSTHDVVSLARDLATVTSFRHWISDFANLNSKRKTPKRWEEKLKAAPFLFEADDCMAFFKRTGWCPGKIITSGEESEAINRPYPLDFPRGLIMRALPREVRRRILNLSGVVLMHADKTPPRLSTQASTPPPRIERSAIHHHAP